MVKEITVTRESLHDGYLLAELVGVANEYSSRITIVMGDRRINAKSIMGIMASVLGPGMVIKIEAVGDDAAEAVAALEEFLSK